MECPYCKHKIEDNVTVCPHCKKTVRVKCHICGALSPSKICHECGTPLVSKCTKCGKVNYTKNNNCLNCGYPTQLSYLESESNTETFAQILIKFPDLKSVLAESPKLYTAVKDKLKQIIKDYCRKNNFRRIIPSENTFVILFNKQYTFHSSAQEAIKTSIELAKLFMRLDKSLLDKRNILFKCDLNILKKNITEIPNDKFQTAKFSDNARGDFHITNLFRITADENFYDILKEDYIIHNIDGLTPDGKMKRFYEINLENVIGGGVVLDTTDKTPQPQKQQNHDISLPSKGKVALDKDPPLGEGGQINFDAVRCNFENVENTVATEKIIEVLKQNPKGVTAVKSPIEYTPYTLKILAEVDDAQIYQNVIPITCTDEMKYYPYSFARELLCAVFEYTASQKLFDQNDFDYFSDTVYNGLLKDIVCLNQRDLLNIDDTRDKYFRLFSAFIQMIPDTLFYIENFEKIDDSSLNIIKQLILNISAFNVGYLIMYNEDYALHKKVPILLSTPLYTELSLTSCPVEKIVEENDEFFKNIKGDYYFDKILEFSKGSALYIDYILQYLVESGIYEYGQDGLKLVNSKKINCPSTIKEIMASRINVLFNEKNVLNFFITILHLGARIDVKTIESLNIPNWSEMIDSLAQRGYVYFYNNCLYFTNYNLLKTCISEIFNKKDLKPIAKKLLQDVFCHQNPYPLKIPLFDILEDYKNVILEWEKMANVNLSMGDFNAYLCCSTKIIESIDNYSINWNNQEKDKYKQSVYSNISNNLLEYNPESFRDIADNTLDYIEKHLDKDIYIKFCIMILQGTMSYGKYSYAYNLLNRAIEFMGNGSINPSAENFKFELLVLTAVKIKILFNIGHYNECIDTGYNILNVLDSQKIADMECSVIPKEEFLSLLVEDIAYVSIADVLSMREDVSEFLGLCVRLLDFIPKEYNIFISLQNMIKGFPIVLNMKDYGQNILTLLTYIIENTFTEYAGQYNSFAREIYKVKLIARDGYIQKFELFADSMIAYSYIELQSYTKAAAILNNIYDKANDYGMNSICVLTNVFKGILYFKQKNYNSAIDILKPIAQNTPKNDNAIPSLFANIYLGLALNSQTPSSGTQYLDNAKNLVNNYGLNIDINKFVKDNQVEV